MGNCLSFRHKADPQVMKSWGHIVICSIHFCSGQSGIDVHTEVHECKSIKNGFTDKMNRKLGPDGCGCNSLASHVPCHHESFYVMVEIELVLVRVL